MLLCYYGLLPKSKEYKWINLLNYWRKDDPNMGLKYNYCEKVGEHFLELTSNYYKRETELVVSEEAPLSILDFKLL